MSQTPSQAMLSAATAIGAVQLELQNAVRLTLDVDREALLNPESTEAWTLYRMRSVLEALWTAQDEIKRFKCETS